MRLLFVLAVCFVAAQAEDKMQDQCMCSVLNPCIESGEEDLKKCGEKCKSHFTDLGGDVEKATKCGRDQEDKIRAAVACVRKSLGEVCTDKKGQKVPQRFHETLQLAAIREITEMVKKSGLLSKTTELFEVAKKGAACMIKCGQQTSCAKKLGCGVALPPDNEIVAKVKTCALEVGFTTPVAKEICNCLVDAGVKQLVPICPHIIIS